MRASCADKTGCRISADFSVLLSCQVFSLPAWLLADGNRNGAQARVD